MKVKVLILFFILGTGVLKAQDFMCRVQVLSRSNDTKITTDDRRIFEDLQRNLTEFINNRKWTKNIIQPNERIEWNLVINITEKISIDEFKGTAQIQSSRPVYGTSYSSPLLNYSDENWRFKYVENQSLEFSETNIQTNLTALVAYYINIVLGLDYDSFSSLGGTEYFQKAQNIVNQTQNFPGEYKGWKAFENNRNRYWFVENALSSNYKSFREAIYTYHRKGLDLMNNNIEEGRNAIMELIPDWQKLARENPNSMMLALYFTAKSDELVNMFSGVDPSIQPRLIANLSEIDPGNTVKYQRIGVKK